VSGVPAYAVTDTAGDRSTSAHGHPELLPRDDFALAPPLATKPPCQIVQKEDGSFDVVTNTDAIESWDRETVRSVQQGETLGTAFRNRWAFIDVSFLIGQMLILARDHKLQNPKDILIPLIKKHIRNRNGEAEILLEGYSIDGIEEVREGQAITGFGLPATRNGTPAYRLVYNLQSGETVIQLNSVAKLYIKIESRVEDSTPLVQPYSQSSKISLPPSLARKIDSIRNGNFKIALIGPSQIIDLDTKEQQEMISSSFLPIGINALAGHLSKSGVEIKVFDPNNVKSLNELFNYVVGQNVILGISPLHDTLQFDLQLLEELKTLCKESLVVAGGIEASTNNGFFLKAKIADLVFSGPAEYSFKDFVHFLRSDVDISELLHIRGVEFLDRAICSTGRVEYSEELFMQTMRMFPWENMDIVNFVKNNNREVRLPVSFLFCKNACKFCSVPAFKRTFSCPTSKELSVTPEQLIVTIRKVSAILSSGGVNPNSVTFYLQDEDFFADISRTKKFILAIKKAKNDNLIPQGCLFSVKARVGFLEEDIYKDLARIGFSTLGLGVEHWDNDVLKDMNKRNTTEKAEETIKMMLKNGIKPTIFLILFPPNATPESANRTLLKAKELQDMGCDVKVNLFVSAYPKTIYVGQYKDCVVYKEIRYGGKIYNTPWLVLPNHQALRDRSIAYINSQKDKNFNVRLTDDEIEMLINYFSGKDSRTNVTHIDSQLRNNTTIVNKDGMWVLKGHRDGQNYITPESERIYTTNFQDTLTYIQAQSAFASTSQLEKSSADKPQSQPLIVALGTSWIKGYEKGRYLQYDALNPLIGNIRSYCESKGIPFVIDDDDKLLTRINAERAKEGKQGAKVVVLAGKDTVASDEFAPFRNDQKNAFVVGVDNQELTTDSYIRLMEMLTLALKLSVGFEISQDSTPIKIVKDDKLHIYIFIPHAEPMDYEQLKMIYEVQKFA
jgi:radical SAM superfamily enzyme YgiQ (UPF0313 family)